MQPRLIKKTINIKFQMLVQKGIVRLYALFFVALFSLLFINVQAQEILNHKVKVGETLSGIAELYEVPMADLMIFNRIEDADAIYLGQILYLPPAAKKPVDKPTSTPRPPMDVQPDSTEIDSTLTNTTSVETSPIIAIISDIASSTIPNTVSETNSVTATFSLTHTSATPLEIIPTPTSIPLVFTVIKPPLIVIKPTPSWNIDHASVVVSSSVTEVVSAVPKTVEQEIGSSLSLEEQSILDDAPAIDTVALTANLNREYSVQSGDTLPLIALRTGVDYTSLLLLNRLTTEDTPNLYIGQKLLLPATDSEFYQSYTTPEEQQTYVVRAGDTLGGIADKYDLPWSLLLEANKLRNANAVYLGQTLIIPTLPDEASLSVSRDVWPHIGPSQRGFNYYTVERGDTLSSIAGDLGTTQLALVEFNGLPDTETVFLGMELRVPYGPPDLPVRTPPVPTSGTAFLVSMSRQQCWVFQGQNVVEEWICSTGYGEWISRTGAFAVQTKQENAKSAAYRLDMPYWLGIYDVGDFENGIHGLPVRWDSGEKIWEDVIGQPATFGCAMLTDEDAKVLFDLSYIGMPVYIMQ